MITQEMLRNTAVALNKIFFATYYCDLQKKTYDTLECTEHAEKMLEAVDSLPEAFERFIQVLVKPEEASSIREFCNLETLSERLSKAPYISCDYDSKLGDGWRQVGFLPAEYDEEGNVTHALFVVRNLDETRSQKIEADKKVHQLIELQRRAAQLVSSSEIVAVALIDRETGATRITTRSSVAVDDREYSFEEWVQIEESFVVPVDRALYRREAVLENLKEKLANDKHYSFAVSLTNKEDQYYYVIHHFTELNDGEVILSVAEDATKWSSVDMVTGCINRAGFSKRAQILIDSMQESAYSVLCFNVRNFKAINSWHGFDNGDRVLKEIGERIQSSELRPVFTCREDSDTFFCLVERKNLKMSEVEKLCKPSYCLDKLQVPVSLKCGIYNICDSKENIHQVCDKARMACADSEKEKDLGFCFFADEMKENYLGRAYILQNYNEAMRNGQIEVFYQPIYDVHTGKIASAEALVRWRHPEQGILSPKVFIPTLEQNGHITELDKFVGNKVWEMQERRIRENRKIVPVSLNLSRYDFHRKQSTSELLDLVRENPLMTKCLSLEVTESSFSDITEAGKEFLNGIRQLGSKVLVDDFGSGYSSLGMLAQFDCDIIKLDKSFADSIGNNRKAEILITSAIQIIHKLGLQAIAEGVETEEQYDFYARSRCDYIQGYYFSRPVTQGDFEKILDSADCCTPVEY